MASRKNQLINDVAQVMVQNPRNKVADRSYILALCNGWELGLSGDDLGAYVGVTNQTINKWMERYPDLNELKIICTSKLRIQARKNIQKAVEGGHLETTRWFLERTDPDFKKNNDTQAQVIVVSVADREKELSRFMERFTDEGVIETVVAEERELPTVGTGENSGAL